MDGRRHLCVLFQQLVTTPFENEFTAEVSSAAVLSSSLSTNQEREGRDEISTHRVVKSEEWLNFLTGSYDWFPGG